MKSTFVLVALFLTGFAAHAETYTCHFTEPFFDVSFDSSTRAMTVNETPSGAHYRFDKIYFRPTGKFQITISNGSEDLMVVTLSAQGKDGISDYVYPFAAKYLSEKGPQNKIGGCESNIWEMQKHLQQNHS